MENKKSCKSCSFMKVFLPIQIGEFMFNEAEARCTNENGVFNRSGDKFPLWSQNKTNKEVDFVDWSIIGGLCQSHVFAD